MSQWVVGPEQPWKSRIDAKELQHLTETLQLTSDQKAVLNVLAHDHAEEIKKLVSDGKSEIAAIVVPAGTTRTEAAKEVDLEEMQVKRVRKECDWAQQLRTSDEKFFQDVYVILNEDQLPLWDQYVRERRWNQLKQMSSNVPGASVNLNSILATMTLTSDEQNEVASILSDYNLMMDSMVQSAIDAAIRAARNDWREWDNNRRINEKLREVLAIGRDDLYDSAGKSLYAGARHELHDSIAPQVALRQANRQFADLLAEKLGDENREKLKSLVRVASYSTAFYRLPSDGYLDQLQKISTLTPDQQAALLAIDADYQSRSAELNDSLVAAVEQEFIAFWNSPADDKRQAAAQQKSAAIRAQRESAADDYVSKLYAVLDDEQQKQAPAPHKRSAK